MAINISKQKRKLLTLDVSELTEKLAESEQQRLAAERKIASLEMELNAIKKAYAGLETIHDTQTAILQNLRETRDKEVQH